jgi:hypothetical protein
MVELACVSGLGVLGREVAEVEIAEGVEAVVDGDDHDIAAMHEAGSVVEVAVDGSVVVGAAVKIDKDGALAVVAQAGGPDVEVETIFALRAQFAGNAGGESRVGARGTQLRSHVGEEGAVEYIAPGRGRGGGFEARHCCVGTVGDGLEDIDAVEESATDFSGGGGGERSTLRPGGSFAEGQGCGGQA